MKHIKYFGIHFLLFCVIILTGFYSRNYIRKPFSYTDLIAIIIEFSLVIVALNLYKRLKKRLPAIHVINKIFLTVLAIFIATFFTGILTGEMRF